MARAQKKKSAIAFWLIPAKPERELLAEIIRILAAELDAPRFESHLTICVVPDTRNARESLRQISAEPIRLRVRNVFYANKFTKTLFVRFEKSGPLEKLNALVRRMAKLPRARLRDPHVSLLYKRMPMSAKSDLASTIRLPFVEVTFDSLKAVRCTSPMKTGADVESWREVARKKLR
jgi:2'-5' RNA ligase